MFNISIALEVKYMRKIIGYVAAGVILTAVSAAVVIKQKKKGNRTQVRY
ncbi:MAG: hypothetical protein WCY18_01445 [Methanofastidiosum sp.]|jgi:hypothetical protein